MGTGLMITYVVRKVGRAVECTGLVESSAVAETWQMLGVKVGEAPGKIRGNAERSLALARNV
jgi:hypothetical protein